MCVCMCVHTYSKRVHGVKLDDTISFGETSNQYQYNNVKIGKMAVKGKGNQTVWVQIPMCHW